jgi:uncharacterized coiled-coil protein SlyX
VNLKYVTFVSNTCYNAGGYDLPGIEAIKFNIPSICKDPTTTVSTTTQQPDQCSDGCRERIEKLEELLEKQRETIEGNVKVIAEQAQAIAEVQEKLRRIASIFL